MIGNIATIDVKIDTDTFQLTKLYAKDSYNLYLKCLNVLSPILDCFIKNKSKTKDGNKLNISEMEFNVEKIISIITEKFSFDDVISLLKSANIKRNYKDVNDSEWNVTSPLLIMELFVHVIKINVINELLNSKKDLGQIVERLFGSKSSQNA